MINQKHMKHLTCLSVLCSSAATAFAAEKPNIIYIFTDQQTATAMSCAGNTDLQTPNLDRLAASGLMFNNAYCTAPLSGPSRAAMFTGRFPDAQGMAANGAAIPDELKKEVLGLKVQEAGYECIYAGKWHVPELSIPDQVYGFDNIHGFGDEGLAEACVEFLDKKHDKPFFLVAAFDNPHNICEQAREQNLPYGNLPQPDVAMCPGLPANFAKNPYDADVLERERMANYNIYPTIRYTSDEWRIFLYNYYRLVEKVDREIGKILDAIDRHNLWKNTVVIFSSDHGDGRAAHNWNQKSALYEEVTNIPFIVTLPGKKHAGEKMPQLINNGVDFYASVCDWAGAELPEGADGKSFRKVVESGDPAMKHQEHIVVETKFNLSTTRGWMVRGERYKYVLYDRGKHREQLFDMKNDRGEMRNLAVEKKYADLLQEHRDLLFEWMKQTGVKQTRPVVHDIPGKPTQMQVKL